MVEPTYYRAGDILRMTMKIPSGDFVRNLVIYEHRPCSTDFSNSETVQSIVDRMKEYETNRGFANNFYRYLDLDTGDIKIGYIPATSPNIIVDIL